VSRCVTVCFRRPDALYHGIKKAPFVADQTSLGLAVTCCIRVRVVQRIITADPGAGGPGPGPGARSPSTVIGTPARTPSETKRLHTPIKIRKPSVTARSHGFIDPENLESTVTLRLPVKCDRHYCHDDRGSRPAPGGGQAAGVPVPSCQPP
jgi:hypothetical protein